MIRTIVDSSYQTDASSAQEGMNASAGTALSLSMKMIAIALMAVKIAAKAALLAITALVSLIVAAVSSLAGIIIAIVVTVVLITAIIGTVVFNNGEDDDGSTRVGMYTFETAYESLEKEYEERIASLVDMGKNAGCRSYIIEGEKAAAEDIVSVYLAVDGAGDYDTFNASAMYFMLDANGINLLSEVYWKFNEINYRKTC